MNTPPAPNNLEHTVAATFLLVHAVMLVVLDLTLGVGSFGVGALGLAILNDTGLQDASWVLGGSLFVGLLAASVLAWILIEVLFGVRALRGHPRSLLMVCIGSFVLSVMLAPISLIGCSVLGIGLSLPMILVSGIALAFAGLAPPQKEDAVSR